MFTLKVPDRRECCAIVIALRLGLDAASARETDREAKGGTLRGCERETDRQTLQGLGLRGRRQGRQPSELLCVAG